MGNGIFTFAVISEGKKDKLKNFDTLEDPLEELKKQDKDKDGRILNP